MPLSWKGFSERIKDFISKNPLISILFLVSNIFFILQHYIHLSWDFSAYILNARYLFYDGSYFQLGMHRSTSDEVQDDVRTQNLLQKISRYHEGRK